MHPGPLNRGIEIDPAVADGPRAVILDQVSRGVAIRMAILYLLAGGETPKHRRGWRRAMPALRDVAIPDGRRPRLLLVGINPGLRSGAEGHHFAGRGNPFWRLLHAAGLTPRLLAYAGRIRTSPAFGIALTNLCPRTTRTAAELGRAEIARGRAALTRKIEAWRPEVVAFVGVTLYRLYFGPAAAVGGAGAKPETIAGARVFVVPNPSGLNASFPGFAEKLVWFRSLRGFLELQNRLTEGPRTPIKRPRRNESLSARRPGDRSGHRR